MKAYGIVRLTRDPELKALSSGSTLAEFGIAWNKKTKDGEDKANFMEAVAWGKTGDVIVEYVSKGDPLFIEGEITFEQWETDGQKRSKHKLTIYNVQFIKPKD